MSDFFSFLKLLIGCGTVFFIALMVLLAMPKSHLRSVAMQVMKYVFAGCLFLLVPSPVDIIPDMLVGLGWADDIAYVAAGIAAIKSANKDRKQRAFEEACENARLAREAGLNGLHDDPSRSGVWTRKETSDERA